MSARFLAGKSTPAIRAIRFLYPCRCLCFGLVQMTRTTPSRWITLHLSHIFLTDARTFISLLLAGTSARATVISRFFHGPDRAAITQPAPDRLAELSQNSSSPLRPHAPEPRLRSPASPSPPRSGAAPLQLLPPKSRPRQDPRTVGGYRHAMLKMRRQRMILGNRRPLVGQNPHVGSAGIHHRLNRQHHAFFQPRILVPAIHVIGDLRLFMQFRADTVPPHLANHRE